MYDDHEGLWFKLLAAKYGVVHGSIQRGERRAIKWWKDLFDIKEGVEEGEAGWFKEMVG